MKHSTRALLVFGLFSAVTAAAGVGGGELVLPASDKGDVKFSHALHVRDIGLKCVECHTKLFTNRKQHKAVTMADMKKGKSCGACHDGKKAFSVKADCGKCHTNTAQGEASHGK